MSKLRLVSKAEDPAPTTEVDATQPVTETKTDLEEAMRDEYLRKQKRVQELRAEYNRSTTRGYNLRTKPKPNT